MDYAEIFERQGRIVDDLLMHAFGVPETSFAAPGPEGSPSLHALLTEWLETQRRAVHAGLLGRAWTPLPAAATATVPAMAQAFGGFRLTLLETLEATFREDLGRKVPWTGADGTVRGVTIDELLAHLAFHGARMTGLIAARLRQLGLEPGPTDLL